MPRSRLLDLPGAMLTLATGQRCPGCGGATARNLCGSCDEQLRRVPDAPGAAFLDTGVAAGLVRRAKRGDWRGGGRAIARVVVADRPQLVPRCDVITWIPADRGRRARRGGHLPQRFAVALGRLLGVPAIALLEPTGRRRPQRGLDRAARAANVRDAFRARRPTSLCAGTRVLVVDDVRTTGATLAAARDALARYGAAVDTFAIVGVETTASAPRRCLEPRSEREISAHESNGSCR